MAKKASASESEAVKGFVQHLRTVEEYVRWDDVFRLGLYQQHKPAALGGLAWLAGTPEGEWLDGLVALLDNKTPVCAWGAGGGNNHQRQQPLGKQARRLIYELLMQTSLKPPASAKDAAQLFLDRGLRDVLRCGPEAVPWIFVGVMVGKQGTRNRRHIRELTGPPMKELTLRTVTKSGYQFRRSKDCLKLEGSPLDKDHDWAIACSHKIIARVASYFGYSRGLIYLKTLAFAKQANEPKHVPRVLVVDGYEAWSGHAKGTLQRLLDWQYLEDGNPNIAFTLLAVNEVEERLPRVLDLLAADDHGCNDRSSGDFTWPC